MTSRSPFSVLRSPLASLAGAVLLAGSMPAQQMPPVPPVAPNTNGQPGTWVSAFAHGDHEVGCAGVNNTTHFRPIHAAVIPKGDFQGWVLVWEIGGQLECRFSNPVPHPLGGDIDVRWALIDPNANPPVVEHMAWRVRVQDAPPPPCSPGNPAGHQGLFCGGHCWLPDGRLLVAGGDYWATSWCPTGTVYAGSRIVMVFDPDHVSLAPIHRHQMQNGPGLGTPWTSLHNPGPGAQGQVDLGVARWYPTATLMAPANFALNPFVYISIAGGVETYDGFTLVRPGDPGYHTHELLRWNLTNGVLSRDPRLGQNSGLAGLFEGPTTPGAAGLSFVHYPRTHFVSARSGSPDGRLWMAGMARQSADADVINAPEVWNNGDTIPLGNDTLLEESTVVLFPPIAPQYRDLQIVIGGMKTDNNHGGTAVTDECWMMPTRATPANWIGPVLRMHHRRKFANAVILPDASIVVVGGGTNPQHSSPGGGQLEPEMFANGSWLRLSNQSTERTYHSLALLLDDGRILSAGGDTCFPGLEYEVFEPPYLQGSPPRPTFVQAPPAVIRYGQAFSFEAGLPFGQPLDRVVLLRPASVTHSQDPGQRYEPLTVLPPPNADTTITSVLAPANATIMPPGYCMLFLVSAGVPSGAAWVQLLP